ncbi:murein L,D-transpeptidase [bacterium]|nr:murein L,D-transpeptidase [candidate division CSSED10-310 bacterium]
MKSLYEPRIFVMITVILVTGCFGRAAHSQRDIPTGTRSRRAIERVRPALIHDLDAMGLTFGSPIFIRIFKKEKELEVWVQGSEGAFVLFRTYPIAAMSGVPGPKERKGDYQAPEGFYFVTPDRLNPVSNYHLSFDIGYPNSLDRSLGRTGSLIMVHGDRVSIGCFAMTDEKIEEIYALADAAFRKGQPFFRLHSFPFRMTDDNMNAYRDSHHYPFWVNLKEGYDLFETRRQPPNVTAANGKYIFDQESE